MKFFLKKSNFLMGYKNNEKDKPMCIKLPQMER